MYLFNTYRSLWQRLRLSMSFSLGAGNFFWHAWEISNDRDRPILFHASEGDGVSLNEMKYDVVRYASWYHARGVDVGDHVGVYTSDGLARLLHHIAITSLGAVAVHANPNLNPATAANYFADTNVSIIVVDPARRPALTDACAAEGTGSAGQVVATEEIAAATVEETGTTPPSHHHDDADLVMISHSSGTTGQPKPASFTHRSFFAGKRERLWSFPSAWGDRLLTALPHSHSAGLSYLSLALLLGLPTLMSDDTSGEAIAEAITDFRPTMVLAFPLTLAELSRAEVTDSSFPSVHTWMGMGDASHESHIRPLVRGGARYMDGLGSSEMGMVLFQQVHTAETCSYGRLIGRPVRTLRDAAVLAEDGTILPDGRAGMLGIHTPSMTPGYWGDQDLTEQSTLGGYLLTGDIVRRDPDGSWYHLDRTPDVINTDGGPVYSLPLEEVVLLETGAHDAAVIAVDDPDGQASQPFAVVLSPDGGDEPEVLLQHSNHALTSNGLSRLAGLAVVHDRAGLPVGPTGKVLKRSLRETYRTYLVDDGLHPDHDAASA